MSTFTSVSSAPLGLRPASMPAHKGVDGIQRRTESARGLTAMLLAAVVAAMVVVADRLISTWADGQLFLAWVFLWVVVFAGMALFADTARSLARRAVVSLDGWSQALAEARAETRMWEMARMDHRLMNELMAARTHAEEAAEEPAQAFAEALAPLGLPEATKTAEPEMGYWERLGTARARNRLMYYI
ncbi:MAG: hypothetical protein ACT6SF_08405 [Hydrogenophaga sp.]|jgi:hypothetical protein|uniref:hypothetical protein n=1 Tax=Hydrogenophaga sp. TaxID=1904254 RepID=UPI001E1A28AE|nr:hypothetical protein [Hydrogenophaga sp.]MBW0171123.1 hypothetical protein [Hydrogenophaga sp.]MBW0184556.1 hypothetical protein [Hydrogenophaga sp.]